MDAEIENMGMYERLLAATQEVDVSRVLSNLQAASRDNLYQHSKDAWNVMKAMVKQSIAEKMHGQEKAGMANSINGVTPAVG